MTRGRRGRPPGAPARRRDRGAPRRAYGGGTWGAVSRSACRAAPDPGALRGPRSRDAGAARRRRAWRDRCTGHVEMDPVGLADTDVAAAVGHDVTEAGGREVLVQAQDADAP